LSIGGAKVIHQFIEHGHLLQQFLDAELILS